MLKDYTFSENATVKYDRMAKSSLMAANISADLMRFIISAESTCRSPYGALGKFMEEGRLDAVVAYAAMYAEHAYNQQMNMDADEEIEVPPIPKKEKAKNGKADKD